MTRGRNESGWLEPRGRDKAFSNSFLILSTYNFTLAHEFMVHGLAFSFVQISNSSQKEIEEEELST